LTLEPRDAKGALYHIALRKGDVARIAFLPGDPGRVPLIAERLQKPRLISSHRGYVTYSGFLGSEKVMVTSTGIGGPSVAIAIEELARLGVEVMIRIGTCGGIQRAAKVGTLIIADSAVRLDGTTDLYAMKGYPAAATPEIVMALKEAAAKLHKKALVGITASTDSFYVGQGRPGYGGYHPSHVSSLMKDLQQARVLCFEMESSTLFTLGRIFGLKTGALFAVIGNDVTNDFRIGAGIPDAIEVALASVACFKKHGV
jgi:uridine phosphorylase